MNSLRNIFLLLLISSPLFAQEPSTDDKKIYTFVDNAPSYVGGQDALTKFLKANIKYPQNAVKAKIQGKVFVKFIVEADGSITGSEIIKGINDDLNSEALRVVGLMPLWSPGTLKEKKVRVMYTLPITFRL